MQCAPEEVKPHGSMKVALGGGAQALQVLTHTEVLLAPPAQDVDELSLISAPLQLTSFQQVLMEWGRGREPESECYLHALQPQVWLIPMPPYSDATREPHLSILLHQVLAHHIVLLPGALWDGHGLSPAG